MPISRSSRAEGSPPLSRSPEVLSTSPSKSPIFGASPVRSPTSPGLSTSPPRLTSRTPSLNHFFSRSRSKSPASIKIKPPARSVTVNNPTSYPISASPSNLPPLPLSPQSPHQQSHYYSSSPPQENSRPHHSPSRSLSDSHASPTSPGHHAPNSSSSYPYHVNSTTSNREKRNSRGAGVNHCGRHGNDWLFGGFSVRETVSRGFEKVASKRDSTGPEGYGGLQDHDR